MSFQCGFDGCSHSCSTKNGINKHRRNIHQTSRQRVGCPTCDNQFADHERMVAHVHAEHHPINIVEKEFPSFEEFESYRLDAETSEISKYVKYKERGLYKIYNCSRSGKARQMPSEKRKNPSLNLATKKTGTSCTARISIKINEINSTVSMRHIVTHYPHECDDNLVPLRDDQKQAIDQMLNMGLTPLQIYNELSQAGIQIKKHDIYNRQQRRKCLIGKIVQKLNNETNVVQETVDCNLKITDPNQNQTTNEEQSHEHVKPNDQPIVHQLEWRPWNEAQLDAGHDTHQLNQKD